MGFKINNSPHLRMHEITKKLFNRKFLSDICFSIDGKIIYAHSLELMKRSIVFEEKFEGTWRDKKFIPVTDCIYEHFLEFVRFIYTDECEINDSNGLELLKLAIKYKIVMLENQVINQLVGGDWGLSLFEYCVVGKYEIARNEMETRFKLNYADRLMNHQFRSLHPDALKVALQFDTVENGVTEIQIFNALAQWINNYCAKHEIPLSEGRQQFYDFIREIRFPTMERDELRDCVQNHPGILSKSDFNSIGKQKLNGRAHENDVWISTNRSVYEFPCEWRQLNRDTTFETKFTVSRDIILHGLWVGIEKNRTDLEIEITTADINQNEIAKIQFIQLASGYYNRMLICLGDSLRLAPLCQCTISIKYLEITDTYVDVLCRKENVDLVYNDSGSCIDIKKTSDNMIQMIFKPAN